MSSSERETSDAEFASALRALKPGDEPLLTTLRTSERVLARVTDGIYRQPGSALRELISNAWDADASAVAIRTDRPRFDRIVISDDGNGMSPEVLQHILHNIGGSAKRSSLGAELEVTSFEDPAISPGGRRLIGKIGIGLFSVAQLTQAFEISTKVRGDNFQSVASVLLSQYSDSQNADDSGAFRTGKVLIRKETATDTESHGTTITLTAVRPQTKEVLRSDDLWHRVISSAAAAQRVQQPLWHVGRLSTEEPETRVMLQASYDKLPWDRGDGPDTAFAKLVNAPMEALSLGRSNPRVENIFDEYLYSVWRLSLAAPLPYVDQSPFDLRPRDARFFILTGRAGAEAQELALHDRAESIRNQLPFPTPSEPEGFSVFIDELRLQRPIRFDTHVETSASLQTPLLFFGHFRSTFPKYPEEFSGGALDFVAYIRWEPKLVPADHVGVLIRINQASGTLFDPKFMGFPTDERRLGQISCEIFVEEGLDGALNIDRESLNETHPHVVALRRWFHGSLRQVIARVKSLSGSAARSGREVSLSDTQERLFQLVERVWRERSDGGEPPRVVLGSPAESSGAEYVLPPHTIGGLTGRNQEIRRRQRQDVVIAFTQLLDAYDLIADLSDDDRVSLVQALYDAVAGYLP